MIVERAIRGVILAAGIGIFLYTVISSAPAIPTFVGGIALVFGLAFGLTPWARLRERLAARFGKSK